MCNNTTHTTSKMTTNTTKSKAKVFKKMKINTELEKYSTRLNEKTKGKLSLISPEIMNKTPVKNLEKEVSNFNIANGFWFKIPKINYLNIVHKNYSLNRKNSLNLELLII